MLGSSSLLATHTFSSARRTMVDRPYYPTDARRYSRGGPLLPVSFPERHRYPAPLQDTRPSSKIMGDRDSGADAPTRKRISVACGRCRKRKIRCSGDPGNGEPCTNCRNANAETCQFLRVASQEASLLQDRNPYGYDLDSARALQRAGVSPSFSSQFGQDVPESLTRYPTSSAAYSYGARYYQSAATWNPGYAEDSVDYSGLSYSPSYYAQESPYPFRVPSSTKAGTAPQLYSDAAAGYHCLSRPATSVDSPSMSLSAVAAALPPALSSERMLPALGQKSSMSNPGLTSYHTDVASVYGMKTAQPSTAETSPANSVPDTSGQYTSYDSSPVSAFTHPSTLPSLNGSHRGSTSTGCSSEAYSVSSTSGPLYDSDSTNRGLHDFAMKCDHPSRRDNETYGMSGGHAYSMQAGPVPSSSIAGRGLLATHAATAPTYMISGGSHASSTSDGNGNSGADTRERGVNDSSATIHSEAQRARAAAASLSAA